MALTQEQIQQILSGGMSPQNIGGSYYMPVMTTGQGSGAEGDNWTPSATGIRQTQSMTPKVGEQNNFYDLQGNYTGGGTYREGVQGLKGLFNDDFMHAITPLIVAGGVAGAQGMGLMPGGASAAGDAFLPGALGVDGAAISTAPLSGLEGYVAGGASGAAGGAVGGDMFMPGQLGANYTPGVIPGLESYVTGSTGGLLGGLGKALGGSKGVGALASVAGGLLGSKPQETSQTSSRSIDPRFAEAIFGQGGLLGMVQNNLSAQRPKSSPLSNITPRGNGFNLFTGR